MHNEKNIAISHHSVQIQDPPKQHRCCPPGENSLCEWQLDLATATSTYKDDDCLPKIFVILAPHFYDIKWNKLLGQSVHGTMQNQTECINSLVWVRCPKHKHYGMKVTCFAETSAVLHFYSTTASKKKIHGKAVCSSWQIHWVSLSRDPIQGRKSDLQAIEKKSASSQSSWSQPYKKSPFVKQSFMKVPSKT